MQAKTDCRRARVPSREGASAFPSPRRRARCPALRIKETTKFTSSRKSIIFILDSKSPALHVHSESELLLIKDWLVVIRVHGNDKEIRLNTVQNESQLKCNSKRSENSKLKLRTNWQEFCFKFSFPKFVLYFNYFHSRLVYKLVHNFRAKSGGLDRLEQS